MSLFDPTIPADSEAVKLGASRIRSVETVLNGTLNQIFDDTSTFLPKWVTGAMIANDPSNNSLRAIGSNWIIDGSILTAKLADGLLTADTTGRAKMANGFVTAAKLDPAFISPVASVNTAALQDGILSADSIGRAKMADGFITAAKIASGAVSKFAVGSYAGSNSSSAVITGLAFAPQFLLITAGQADNRMGVAFLLEATSNIGPIHRTWDSSGIVSPLDTAIQWQSNGFTVVPTNTFCNQSGILHRFLALAS